MKERRSLLLVMFATFQTPLAFTFAIAVTLASNGCAQSPVPSANVQPPPAPRASPSVLPVAPNTAHDTLRESAPARSPVPMPSGPAMVGVDDAPGPRVRKRTAVLLFGTSGMHGAPGLRFVPVLCAIDGKLVGGLACGEAMPPKVRVRTTRAQAHAQQEPAILTLHRSTRDFHDDAGDHVYRAPRGPACCMYNTCGEETIPYLTAEDARTPKATSTSTQPTVLAVWPPDADVDLKPLASGHDPSVALDAFHQAADEVQVMQSLRRGQAQLASAATPPCRSCATLWFDQGAGWHHVASLGGGASSYDALATTDLDGDGRAEVVIYQGWPNDYGLLALGNDWSRPLYAFSCGNI